MIGQSPGGDRFFLKKIAWQRHLFTWSCMVETSRGVLHLHRNGLSRPLLVWASSSLPHHFLQKQHVAFRTCIGWATCSIEDKNPNGSFRIHLPCDWTSVHHPYMASRGSATAKHLAFGARRKRLALNWSDATHRLGVGSKKCCTSVERMAGHPRRAAAHMLRGFRSNGHPWQQRIQAWSCALRQSSAYFDQF